MCIRKVYKAHTSTIRIKYFQCEYSKGGTINYIRDRYKNGVSNILSSVAVSNEVNLS